MSPPTMMWSTSLEIEEPAGFVKVVSEVEVVLHARRGIAGRAVVIADEVFGTEQEGLLEDHPAVDAQALRGSSE